MTDSSFSVFHGGFTRPTLSQLRERAIAEINARLPDADARLRHSVLNVVACVLAAQTHELYGYLEWIARQVFPDTANTPYLEQWGGIWGLTRRLASFAGGRLHVRGKPQSALPRGLVFRRGDGLLYETLQSAILPESGEGVVEVKARTAGTAANAATGVRLLLTSPLEGIHSEAQVAAPGITGGAEREDDDSYRSRILSRIQEPPQGGSQTDYERWAMEVPGVTRAWCAPVEKGPGTVSLRFMMDTTYGDGIPQTGDVERVRTWLEAHKPIGAHLFVMAPLAQPVAIILDGLSPDLPEVRTSIRDELARLFMKHPRPGAVLHLSRIWKTIHAATGVEHFTLREPTADITPTTGTIPTLGEVRFTAPGGA